MASIHLLEDSLIDKIAAGEVVEKPASVVKELLENAIDAGASTIQVELLEGGSREIKVTDNGSGIGKDDLPMAVRRHATSKIRASEDLFAISSMGFRGEALASVASVSNFSIASQLKGSARGARLSAAGGSDWRLDDWEGNSGTVVRIRDLFFNVPARLKFLKSAQSEFASCLELVEAMALAYPQVAFTFSHNGKEKFNAPLLAKELQTLTQIRARAETVLDKDLVSKLLFIEKSNEFGSVKGLISPPGLEKATGKNIYTFVNHRWVKDKAMRYGIMRGYHSHLLSGKYPVAIIFYDCEPSLVDVNVHPAKTEVRFQYSGEMQGLIATAIREAIRSGSWALPETELFPQTSQEKKQSLPPSSSYKPPKMSSTSFSSSEIWEKRPSSSFGHYLPEKKVLQLPEKEEYKQEIAVKVQENTESAIAWQDLKWRGILFACYIFFEYDGKLLVIDQHAFHERILFERLKTDPDILSHIQPLLVPEILDFTPVQVAALCERKEILIQLGFDFAKVSDKEIELRSVPSLLVNKDIHKFLLELSMLSLNNVDINGQNDDLLQVLTPVLATIACHSAVRQGEVLSEKEWGQLLQQAQTVNFTLNCPHGRRVFRWFKKSAVESWFDR